MARLTKNGHEVDVVEKNGRLYAYYGKAEVATDDMGGGYRDETVGESIDRLLLFADSVIEETLAEATKQGKCLRAFQLEEESWWDQLGQTGLPDEMVELLRAAMKAYVKGPCFNSPTLEPGQFEQLTKRVTHVLYAGDLLHLTVDESGENPVLICK